MRSVQACLQLVVKGGSFLTPASEIASQAGGFSEEWGGRSVRRWTRAWIDRREMPWSDIGKHSKVDSLLDDPAVRAELRSYVRSNKWSMDPVKLAQYSKMEMVPAAATKYAEDIVNNEIPKGIKKYLELELFPRIHLKAVKGVSLNTARRWLRAEGFRYTQYKKAIYFDGHEHPDVVEDRQKHFLPFMAACRYRLVEYVVGDVDKEVDKRNVARWNCVEPHLVLVAQDEMTAQANDDKGKGWIYDGEQPIKKKGVGRGQHQSDVICSTIGHLKEASQSLEYGKNYDGYWNGKLFVKQVSVCLHIHSNVLITHL